MSLYVNIYKKLGKFTLDISFEASGGVTGLLGASGGGKTMTLKCIAGIEKPDRGKIVLDGATLFDSERHINLTPQERRVGYLFQNYALFPNMNVRQNILCGVRREAKAEKDGKLSEILGMMQLNGLEKHKPHQLSGGQQQRVALARIMIGNPRLLMLDEPFSSLDSHLRGQLQLQMQELLKQFGKDALVVTHSRGEAYRLCGHIALVDSGKILAHKETKALFSDPESRQAALLTGCKNVVDAKKTGEYEVEVPAWGVRLATAQPIRDGLCAIGIRAHYFNPKSTQNSFPVSFTGIMEEPFEYILQFRYGTQDKASADIWWRTPKYRKSDRDPTHLGIAPVNVLPLYE
jgi:molybdate transport system ATP-binding protein